MNQKFDKKIFQIPWTSLLLWNRDRRLSFECREPKENIQNQSFDKCNVNDLIKMAMKKFETFIANENKMPIETKHNF